MSILLKTRLRLKRLDVQGSQTEGSPRGFRGGWGHLRLGSAVTSFLEVGGLPRAGKKGSEHQTIQRRAPQAGEQVQTKAWRQEWLCRFGQQ